MQEVACPAVKSPAESHDGQDLMESNLNYLASSVMWYEVRLEDKPPDWKPHVVSMLISFALIRSFGLPSLGFEPLLNDIDQ